MNVAIVSLLVEALDVVYLWIMYVIFWKWKEMLESSAPKFDDIKILLAYIRRLFIEVSLKSKHQKTVTDTLKHYPSSHIIAMQQWIGFKLIQARKIY